MRRITKLFIFGIAMMMQIRAASAQEPKDQPASDESETDRGPVEFGFRTFWGGVYGRPTLPFSPSLATAKFNEYGDVRKNNMFIRSAKINLDSMFGTQNYFRYQTKSSFYKNQSHLASFGGYGKF